MSLDVYLTQKHGICEHCGRGTTEEIVFQANITHNLNTMADEAGVYRHVWRPEEVGIVQAWELEQPLRSGITLLESDPARFKAFEPSNKWGTYDALVKWLKEYLAACEKYPEAYITSSR